MEENKTRIELEEGIVVEVDSNIVRQAVLDRLKLNDNIDSNKSYNNVDNNKRAYNKNKNGYMRKNKLRDLSKKIISLRAKGIMPKDIASKLGIKRAMVYYTLGNHTQALKVARERSFGSARRNDVLSNMPNNQEVPMNGKLHTIGRLISEKGINPSRAIQSVLYRNPTGSDYRLLEKYGYHKVQKR